MTTAQKICLNCKAWRERKGNLNPDPIWRIGQCCRRSPISNAADGMAYFPDTYGGDWCLDFIERPDTQEDRASRLLGTKYMSGDAA